MAGQLKRPGTAVIFALLVVGFGILLSPRVMQIVQLKTRSQNLEREINRLRRENLALETELRLLRDDPVYLEKVAREKLNKAKTGEIVYKVVRADQNTH